MLIMSSIIFMFMNHPLSKGMMLLMCTIFISLSSGFLTLNYFYSYILFLIMIGGMMILFMYMTSVASNEKFKKINFSALLFITLISLLSSYFIKPPSMIFFNENISKLLNYPTSLTMLLTIIYLLITMIAVIKIVSLKSKPLRQTF
uniref:NADH-ubiquinone oxidoreductase chain 6 n=1 Tax=Aspidiphorus orbiculatus TaxID=577441 RepID=A0A0S2M6R4_9CUCU|nr:NADH deshydrogenase subunit 6 [Aspidiphorus orbiculatus]